jgi:hypothetical protein
MLGLLGRFRRYPAEPFDRNVRRLGRYNATFPGQGMIAKLFRTIRMNFLHHEKCFRGHTASGHRTMRHGFPRNRRTG